MNQSVAMSDFFLNLNNELESFNSNLVQDLSSEHPLILVNGLPRSGTTLLMQYLSCSFSVLYINNLMARFWKAPLVGLKLSQASNLSAGELDFDSDFGRTNSLSSPHEFSYFWKEWLRIPEDQAYHPQEVDKKIDWIGLRKILIHMQEEANAPLMMKAMHPARHIAQMRKHFKNIIVVHIERDPLEVCRSLKKARIKRLGDANAWWSLITTNYSEIEGHPYYLQIPRQIKSLAKEYESNYELLEEKNLIRVDFNDFVSNPALVRAALSDRLRELSGIDYRRITEGLPESFNTPEANDADALMDAEVRRLF